MRMRLAVVVITVLLASFAASGLAEVQHHYRETVRKLVAQLTPLHVRVEDLDFDGPKVLVRGTTDNPNAAANFVENVKAHPKFTRPEDISVRERKGSDPKEYEFEFRFEVKDHP